MTIECIHFLLVSPSATVPPHKQMAYDKRGCAQIENKKTTIPSNVLHRSQSYGAVITKLSINTNFIVIFLFVTHVGLFEIFTCIAWYFQNQGAEFDSSFNCRVSHSNWNSNQTFLLLVFSSDFKKMQQYCHHHTQFVLSIEVFNVDLDQNLPKTHFYLYMSNSAQKMIFTLCPCERGQTVRKIRVFYWYEFSRFFTLKLNDIDFFLSPRRVGKLKSLMKHTALLKLKLQIHPKLNKIESQKKLHTLCGKYGKSDEFSLYGNSRKNTAELRMFGIRGYT